MLALLKTPKFWFCLFVVVALVIVLYKLSVFDSTIDFIQNAWGDITNTGTQTPAPAPATN